jgi:hypothetical protein
VCGLHRAQGDEECRFLSLASKLVATVSPGQTSKSVAMVSSGPVLKPVATVLVVWPQNHSLKFSGLDLKISSCGSVIFPTKLS